MPEMEKPQDAPPGFQEAWDAHDTDARGSLFDADATFVNRFAHHVRGVDETMYSAREAREADLASLPAIEHAAAQLFLSTPYPEIAREQPSSVDAFRRWRERAALLVAAAEGGEPMGFAIAFDVDGAAHLHEIDVDPQHGRRGVGRRLIGAVASWALARGHTRITLATFRDVAWNGPYYRRLGFRELPAERAGAGLLALREEERANGLAIDDRLFMVLDLAQPK